MIRGLHQDLDQVEAVVEAYSILTQAIEQRQIPPYSEDVIRHATAITKVLNSHITSVAFITDDYQAVINEPVKYSQKKHYTLGLVNGFVRTITDSPRIRLALFDSIFKQRVWCELEPDQQELARNVWRKQVSVTGSIYRAPSNGRPIQVRNISDVKIVEQVQPGSYRQARGIVPWREGDEPSEVIIRRIRDAS